MITKMHAISRFANVFILLSFFFSGSALGGVYVSVAGSTSTTSRSQTYKSRSISGTLGCDLGNYLRLGYTHRQSRSYAEGYAKNEYTEDIEYSEIDLYMISNSVDLSVILYAGETFVPYIFGGVVIKKIRQEKSTSDPDGGGTTFKSEEGTIPQPQFGAGVGIKISERFTLKLSHTMSPGAKLENDGSDDGKSEATWDEYTSIGIQYKI